MDKQRSYTLVYRMLDYRIAKGHVILLHFLLSPYIFRVIMLIFPVGKFTQ